VGDVYHRVIASLFVSNEMALELGVDISCPEYFYQSRRFVDCFILPPSTKRVRQRSLFASGQAYQSL
jgi:hypothetical protein